MKIQTTKIRGEVYINANDLVAYLEEEARTATADNAEQAIARFCRLLATKVREF